MLRIYCDKCGSEIPTENDANTIAIYGSAIKRKTGEYMRKSIRCGKCIGEDYDSIKTILKIWPRNKY